MADDAPRSADGTVRWLELEDARDMLLLAAAVLERWDRRLQRVADHLPDPRFVDETDEPDNLSAAWQGMLTTLLDDELRPAIAALRRAATWQDDRAGGFPRG